MGPFLVMNWSYRKPLFSGFALSSLETTLKNSRNPESPRDNNTWQSLGLEFYHATVGACGVNPAINVRKSMGFTGVSFHPEMFVELFHPPYNWFFGPIL